MNFPLCIMLVIQIATLLLQSESRNLPFVGTRARKNHPQPTFGTNNILSVRGGSSGKAVGVIDLRPDGSSSVFGNDTLCDLVIVSNSVGTFPVSTLFVKQEENDQEEENDLDYDLIMSLQSAAAETIGTFCGSICLFLAYDPKDGKTVLHRTAGVKLSAVINGMRQRQQQQQQSGSVKPETTRLTLLLFCNGDKRTVDWDPKGVEFLVDRLKAFFKMGIVEDDVINAGDPFEDIDIVPLWNVPNGEIKAAQKQVLSKSTTETTDVSFKSQIQNSYDEMGGVGEILYDALGE